MRQVRSIPSLYYFRVAAELESFSKAAEQLNVTHGAISRAIRLLEEDLGTNLFDRRNRAVFLTESGRKLLNSVANAFDEIDDTVRSISVASTNKTLTLSCEPTLMMRWLIPRLPKFKAAHPDIDIQLLADGGDVVLGGQIDLAIRRNDFEWPKHYQAVKLFEEEIAAVCQARRVEDFFEGKELKLNTPRLGTATRPEAWQNWSKTTGVKLDQNPVQHFEHFYFSIQAAIAGIGVAIGPKYLVKDDINTGLLAAPSGFHKDGSSYYLLSLNKIEDDSIEAKFLRWVTKIISTEN